MQLLLAVGTKLEHVITQLAGEVAAKHIAVEGDLVVKPSDDHFWFHRPRLVLFLIHIILFQNSFEIAFFFWIWVILKNIDVTIGIKLFDSYFIQLVIDIIAFCSLKGSISFQLLHHGTSWLYYPSTCHRVSFPLLSPLDEENAYLHKVFTPNQTM